MQGRIPIFAFATLIFSKCWCHYIHTLYHNIYPRNPNSSDIYPLSLNSDFEYTVICKYKESKITTSLCELRNMINVAHLIISQSLERTKNKGGYYNIDNVK